jgi:L-fuconolactonase
MILDAHHHFWKYDPVAYDWITEDMASIRKDFLPGDLLKELHAAGVDGVISVQARQSIAETEWLLELAGKHGFIKGVTGWLPLADDRSVVWMERYAENRHLKAVRHVLQAEEDEFMLSRSFNHGISLLAGYQLIYEILVYERQLETVIRFVDKNPDQVFVVDHIAKPRIRENILSPWRENIFVLAERPNIYCKLSGLVTEASFESWNEEQLRPYMDTVLEAFGPGRLMFGSDWPVCLVACAYDKWLGLVKRFISTLSVDEQDNILGANAIRLYKLDC